MTIQQLPHLLKWNDSELLGGLCRNMWANHLEFLVRRISIHAYQDDSERGPRAISNLKTLPYSNFKYVLESPEACHSVYRAADSDSSLLWSFIESSINAERILLGEEKPSDLEVWDSMGRIMYGTNSNLDSVISKSPEINGLVFDFYSPYARKDIKSSEFRPSFGKYKPYSEKTLSDVLDKCFEAVRCLARLSGSPWILVNAMIKTVMPRIDVKSDTYKGSSNRGIIGRVNLINPQLDSVNYTQIANSLLHEAIHIILYLHEEQDDLFYFSEEAISGRIQSPWSGDIINPRAYVHGAFVWYGLYMFWAYKQKECLFDEYLQKCFTEFCLKGYRQGLVSKRLAQFRHIIREDVWTAIEEMETNIIESGN